VTERTHDERKEEDLERVRRHVAQLAEHFDSVEVFCTRSAGEETMSVNLGAGNWFTRYGQVVEWILKADARTCNAVDAEDDM